MADHVAAPLAGIWNAICAPPDHLIAHHHGLVGPALGNILVAGVAGAVTVWCIVVAARMLIRPGEADPNHPKYRVLRADR